MQMGRSFLWKSKEHEPALSRKEASLNIGCGKTVSAQQSFDGLRVWDKERVPPQDVEQPSSKSNRLIAGICC